MFFLGVFVVGIYVSCYVFLMVLGWRLGGGNGCIFFIFFIISGFNFGGGGFEDRFMGGSSGGGILFMIMV